MSLKNKQLVEQKLSGISISKRNSAEKNNQRARNPVTPSRMTVRGQFPSKKMQRMIAWESQLERRACYLFEFSGNIVSFREQPERLIIPYEDKIKRYTPDFEVINSFGEISYCEIKPFEKLMGLKHYFQHIDCYLQKRGIHFFVLTEAELVSPIRELNLITFRKYQMVEVSTEIKLLLNDIYSYKNFSPLHFNYLEQFLGRKVIYSAMANGYLECDLNHAITDNTPVYFRNSKGESHAQALFYCRTAPSF